MRNRTNRLLQGVTASTQFPLFVDRIQTLKQKGSDPYGDKVGPLDDCAACTTLHLLKP